jgi:GT2 family glycosyltransferase
VTAIVPLYRRTDFLEHQLARFAWDPSMRDVELVYVLDSPELEDQLLDQAPLLFALYRVPFRVLVLSENAGYSLASNAAAKHASGEHLLLLNSDVLPTTPGWVGRLADALDSASGVGAVGPKLIYEDGTLQHAGMYFARSARGTHWENHHYFKGLDRDFPPANVARDVPAVTGACLLVRTAVFRDLGGLSGMYVQGDFEDSDLCLRLRRRGLTVRYVPQVELYHLEGQSYPGTLRAATYRYNSWLHTWLWNGPISEIVAVREREGVGP